MSVQNFVPTIWSDMIFQAYDKSYVFGALSNRRYEGMIQGAGSSVKINEIGAINTTAYTKDTDVTFQLLDDASKTLLIDKQYYSAFSLDDVDSLQANADLMAEATRKMGVALGDVIDLNLAGLYTEAGITSGSTGSPTSVTSATVLNNVLTIGTLMDNKNCPRSGRVAIVPPWFAQKLALAKIAKDTNNSETLTSGYVGSFAGFDFYMSNNVSHSSTTWYAPMFFIRNETFALASQLNKIEAGRVEKQFGDYMKALIVFGSKVVRPDSLAVLYCAEGAET